VTNRFVSPLERGNFLKSLSSCRMMERAVNAVVENPCPAYITFIVLVFLSLLSGCGGNSQARNPPTQGLATPPPAGQINSYFGTDGNIWSVNIDHSNSQITGKNLTNGILLSGSAAGTFAPAGGFLNITLSANGTPPNLVGQIGGFALDLPGRAALLRLGDQTNPLIPLVSTGSCIAIGGTVTYQYVTIPSPSWDQGTETAYGSFQASTNGPNWTVANVRQFTLAGMAPSIPGTGVPPGYCAQSTLGFAVTAASNSTNPPIATVTMGFGSSGFFLEDNGAQQGSPQGVVPSNALGAGVGAIGIVQPSSPVSTSSVVGARYLGFFYEPFQPHRLLPKSRNLCRLAVRVRLVQIHLRPPASLAAYFLTTIPLSSLRRTYRSTWARRTRRTMAYILPLKLRFQEFRCRQ